MASLNINDKTAESLAARAAAEGISVDEAIQRLLTSGIIVRPERPIPVVELDALLDQELTEMHDQTVTHLLTLNSSDFARYPHVTAAMPADV